MLKALSQQWKKLCTCNQPTQTYASVPQDLQSSGDEATEHDRGRPEKIPVAKAVCGKCRDLQDTTRISTGLISLLL